MDADKGILADPLAVALTRPTMKYGVTYPALVLIVMVTFETFIFTRNLAWLLLAVPLYGICFLVCMNDPRTFELLVLWAKTKFANLLRSRNYWSASSSSPLPLRQSAAMLRRLRMSKESP